MKVRYEFRGVQYEASATMEKHSITVRWNYVDGEPWQEHSDWLRLEDKEKMLYSNLSNWDLLEAACEALGAKIIKESQFGCQDFDEVDVFTKKLYDFSNVKFEE